ncbi:MAG: DEAD/DEAH box helicase [Staphylococcus epidermidis]|nr:DEAD/DEAH box helicase [Staphylococcus epidermidis]
MIKSLSIHQKQAIKKLEKYKIGALFMEPGTGKTRTAVELVNSSNADMLLFMTPCRNINNIKEELSKWRCNKKIYVYGIESLSNSDRIFIELINLVESYQHVFMVVDESLKIKNNNAIRTKRINTIGKRTEYRLILNGTPLSKNIIDVYSQMEFLSPKILKMDYESFINRYIQYIDFDIKKKKNITKVKGYRNLDNLYSLISPFVYDSKLSITPSYTHINENYYIDECLEEYKNVKFKYISMIYNDPNIFMAMTQQMQQSYALEGSKFKIVDKYINDKTIVFCKFIKSKEELEERYPNNKILTYGTGSLGLNLQSYNQIIFFDKTFNYAQKEQAERRIYRMGQNSDCKFIELTGDVGLETFIDKNIRNKTTLLDSFKEAVINDKTKVILDEL